MTQKCTEASTKDAERIPLPEPIKGCRIGFNEFMEICNLADKTGANGDSTMATFLVKLRVLSPKYAEMSSIPGMIWNIRSTYAHGGVQATVKFLVLLSGLSRAKFARRYRIPLRTIENWALGVNSCSDYFLNLLAFSVVSDSAAEQDANQARTSERPERQAGLDHVNVVRCKDCVYCIDGFVCTDGQFHGMTFPYNFCSDGERTANNGKREELPHISKENNET